MDTYMFNLNSDYLTDISVEVEDNISRYLPERSLLRAILYRAVLDLTDRDVKIRSDAVFWFLLNESTEWGSYLHVCSVIGIEDIAGLRDGIFRSLENKILKLEEESCNNDKYNYIRSRLLRYIENIAS
jgi:hypothetical protein